MENAKWEINCDGYYPYCTACGQEPESGELTDICPHCGSTMENPKITGCSKIDEFDGDFSFLSNFYPCTVHYDGISYPSSENAYQAAKCANLSDREQFIKLTPGQAKRLGQKVELRPDWDTHKYEIMEEILFCKFTQNPRLARNLIMTDNAFLIEGNTWGDKYWGVDLNTHEGLNMLGKLLIKVRNYLGGSFYG